jgi:endonuclease/exonuclease/phosphatase family metal-dependent hydrolase
MMSAFRLLLLAGSLVLYSCSAVSPAYTVMTYNIRHGVGMDRQLNLERTARVIAAAQPDILILNEMDSGTQRSQDVHEADSLGKRLGMQVRFGRSIDYDGGEYGNALLSRFPIIRFEVLDLSVDTLAEGRSVFVAAVDLGSDTVWVMGTHLGLQEFERRQQILKILDNLPASPKLLLAGDFNLEPDEAAYALLTTVFTDGVLKLNPGSGPTYPADYPQRRIDYIFTKPGLVPQEIITWDTAELSTASDHRPQALVFRLRP